MSGTRDAMPDELATADVLLEQADALLRRHRPAPADDDLPVLTEVVDLPETCPIAEAPPPADVTTVPLEQLAGLDRAIAEAIETWIADELPQILSRELDALTERVREQALMRLRSTLEPQLAREIAARLCAAPASPD